jgi:hypothetical protein
MTIAKVYGLAVETLLNAEIDWLTYPAVCLLADSSYTPNQDTHKYISDITGEANDGSYSRQTLTGKTQVYSAGTNLMTLDCADVVFATLTETNIRYAIFAIDNGTADSASPLLCYWDFEANQNPVAANFTLNISASGLITFTVA